MQRYCKILKKKSKLETKHDEIIKYEKNFLKRFYHVGTINTTVRQFEKL